MIERDFNRCLGLISHLRRALRGVTLQIGGAVVVAVIGNGTAPAQAIPAATADPISTGFQLPVVAGSMTYSVGAFESLTTGFFSNTGFQGTTGLNGNFGLISPSKLYPFSLVGSAGRIFSTSSQPSSTYLGLGISQVINAKRWNYVLSDTMSYTPATPSVGLGGVPGNGNVGLPPIGPGTDLGQGLLTQYSDRIYNTASLGVSRRITAKTSLQGSGSYSITRFLGDATPANCSVTGVSLAPCAGLENDSYSGSGGLNHAINARNSWTVTYGYSKFVYKGSTIVNRTQTVSVEYDHAFSRRLTATIAVGPQFTKTTGYPTSAPDQTNAFVSSSLGYTARAASYKLSYNRSANTGFGAIAGGRSDSVQFIAAKNLARVWALSLSSFYTHSTSLVALAGSNFSAQTTADSVQVSRALARSLSVYASYTLEKQTGSGGASGAVFDLFTGSFQVFGFGITYAPRAIHLGSR